tara:strand:- start:2669 stop:3328 length:660 start_codon:yes stop_codon:yes gene_type:complete
MTYETDTKDAYRNETKANAYKNQYIQGFKWARFTMWKQKKIIKNFLSLCNFSKNDKVLDVPCGAGYIGDLLSGIDAQITASDISIEMMKLADNEYPGSNFQGFLQSDITNMPLRNEEFRCSIILALMHRLPREIRKEVLTEIKRVTSEYIIISYSIESFAQKFKQTILSLFHKTYLAAPSSITTDEITHEFEEFGLKIKKQKRIIRFLSAKVVFLLEKS